MHFLVFCYLINIVSGAFLGLYPHSTSINSFTPFNQNYMLEKERYAIKKSPSPFQIRKQISSSSTLSVGFGIDEENTSGSKEMEKKELTPDTIVEMIEVTFVNACLQLSKGYVFRYTTSEML